MKGCWLMNFKKNEWEESYSRKENFAFCPGEEYVKFINRFIRKRIGIENEFIDILKCNHKLKGLDFGCGIGRNAVFLTEFNIQSFGIDLSETAIDVAKSVAKKFNCENKVHFQTYDGTHIPFEDNFFDFTTSCGVLDSMPIEMAKKMLNELHRVTKKYCYISLISSLGYSVSEIVVKEAHEKGTIQSFYDLEKIKEFIGDTKFKIVWGELISQHNILNPKIEYGRYHIILEKVED